MGDQEKAANEAPEPQKCEQLAEWAGNRRFEHIDASSPSTSTLVGGGAAGDRTSAKSKEQADHSLPYLCAAALLDGDVWPEQLTGERVHAEDVQDLMRRVWVRQREELSVRYPNEMPCRATIVLRDGGEVTNQKSDYQGFWRTRPLDWERALAKFDRLAGPALDPALRREIPQAVQALDSIPVSELTDLIGRAGRPRARASA